VNAAVEPVLERFERERDRDRLPQVCLLIGRSRDRLRVLADGFAAAYLQPRGEVREHAEYFCLDPDELGVGGLKVEHIAIRKEGVPCLEEALRFRATGNGRRAVLLFEADRMNPDAQAALLKTSEEPPAGTLLVLTAAELTPLLPALRSRCRVYRVSEPLPAALERGAAAVGLDPETFAVLAVGCGAESALKLDPADRQRLLEVHAAFATWLAADCEGEPAWVQAPEGAGLADQRLAASQELSAALGWLAAAYATADPGLAFVLDRTAVAILAALEDLGRNVAPGLVFEDLGRQLQRKPLPG